ncbi:YkgJ family cysteine cluster protein [Sulfurospirillum cavolei]|uniref:YkgJ family cysteine cluster protein n=1 Tax=Sulfurospirillum cavolei TaxID=366522 RepID=UPI0005A76FE4|nr:YkgJ family cysteine cluster protein [Sulfurospirillum cavolei]
MAELMRCNAYPYAFDPNACETCQGNCCIGESGYIWVSTEEIEAIAAKLSLSKALFINNYLNKIRYRFTIKEVVHESGYACIFFDSHRKQCGIYEVRPKQCRTFPFWEHFKDNMNEVVSECPGIIPL